MTDLPNIHPGEVLSEEFLRPLGLSQNRLALDIGVPSNRINDIVRGRRAISADTALRLSRYLNTTSDFWLRLQMTFDLEEARKPIVNQLSRIQPLPAALQAPTQVVKTGK